MYNRLLEKSGKKCETPQNMPSLGPFKNGFYDWIITNNYYLSSISPNNFYNFNNNIYKVNSISERENSIVVSGYRVLNTTDLFQSPLNSGNIGIWHSTKFAIEDEISFDSPRDITKSVALSLDGTSFSFFPVIHDGEF